VRRAPTEIIRNAAHESNEHVDNRRETAASDPVLLKFPQVRLDLRAPSRAQPRRHARGVDARPQANESDREFKSSRHHAGAGRRRTRRAACALAAARSALAAASPEVVNVYSRRPGHVNSRYLRIHRYHGESGAAGIVAERDSLPAITPVRSDGELAGFRAKNAAVFTNVKGDDDHHYHDSAARLGPVKLRDGRHVVTVRRRRSDNCRRTEAAGADQAREAQTESGRLELRQRFRKIEVGASILALPS